MPAQTGKSSVDFNKALKKAKEKPVEYRREMRNLPGGISGGVARLVEMKFGIYKEGQYKGKEFFYAAGVVQEPLTALEVVKTWEQGDNPKGKGVVKILASREVKVFGARTSIMVPLCQLKENSRGEVSTVQDQVNRMMGYVRGVGGKNTEDICEDVESKDDLLPIFEQLKEAGPFFNFSTRSTDPTKEYPNPRVFEEWHGGVGLEDYVAEEVEGVTETEEEGGEEAAEETEVEGEGDDEGGGGKKTATSEEEEDLDALAATADDDDMEGKGQEEAQERLTELGKKVGLTSKQLKDASTFAEVVELIREKDSGAEMEEEGEEAEEEEAAEEEEETPEPWKPAKGEVCLRNHLDKAGKVMVSKKTGKKMKPTECVIVSIDAKKKTCTLKDNTDKKTLYKDVPLAHLDGPPY